MEEATDRLLVVVAHPDDETFGCGSLLAYATASGMSTVVACATRGEAGSPTPGRGLDHADIAEVREAELRNAAALVGVARVEVFDWLDSGMDGSPGSGTLCAATIDEVATPIVSLIDEFRPTIVVTLDASDGHRDHERVRDATIHAVGLGSWCPAAVYLHCLPQQLMRKWVEALVREQPDSDHLGLGDLGTPEADITTVIDTSEFLELREQAIALHRSQTSPYEVMPPELRRDFLTAERLRRIHPPWNGDSIETCIGTRSTSSP